MNENAVNMDIEAGDYVLFKLHGVFLAKVTAIYRNERNYYRDRFDVNYIQWDIRPTSWSSAYFYREEIVRNLTQEAREHKLTPEECVKLQELIRTMP